jgi:hypothetical protein
MKIILILTKIFHSSTFWCETFETEYTIGNTASCVRCESNFDCLPERECWADAWCKSDILCGNEEVIECNPLLPSPTPEISPRPLPFSSPPSPSPPQPSPSPPQPSPEISSEVTEDVVIKYFKEIGLPIIIAIIGFLGSIIGRTAFKQRKRTKRKKQVQIQLTTIQSSLDDDNLSDEASETLSTQTIETERV